MARSSTLSFPELTAAARGIAHFNSEPDPDGVYRRMPLLIGYADGYLPGLALRLTSDGRGAGSWAVADARCAPTCSRGRLA